MRYTYDAAGNVLSVDDHLSSNVEAYSYDALGRVVQAQSPTIGVKIYAYDKNGNVLTKDNRGYAYASAPAHGVDTIDNNSFFEYDANGNLWQATESGQVRTYLYDTENRLESVAKDGVLLAGFNYDDSGERTAKTAAGKTRHFVYPFHEKEGASETNYIYLNGQRVASIVNGQLKYIHADHLGSAQVVSNTSGATLETTRYEPFGDFKNSAPTKSGNYYTGQYFDKETGLYYYGARYYNPRVGQFTTADTIVSNPALSQSFNRYSYVQNNPLNFTDPTGHVIFDVSQRIEGSYWLTQQIERDGMTFDITLLSGTFSSEITRQIDLPEMKYSGMEDFLKDIAYNSAPVDFCQSGCPTIAPKEMSTFDQISLGLGFFPIASTLSLSTKVLESSGHVFWAGGRVAEDAATKWAMQNGAKTLGMTPKGAEIKAITSGMEWSKSRALWMNVSEEFAKKATGTVHVFHNNAGISLQSVWRMIEYPILKNNSNVRILFHNVP